MSQQTNNKQRVSNFTSSPLSPETGNHQPFCQVTCVSLTSDCTLTTPVSELTRIPGRRGTDQFQAQCDSEPVSNWSCNWVKQTQNPSQNPILKLNSGSAWLWNWSGTPTTRFRVNSDRSFYYSAANAVKLHQTKPLARQNARLSSFPKANYCLILKSYWVQSSYQHQTLREIHPSEMLSASRKYHFKTALLISIAAIRISQMWTCTIKETS